MKIIRANGFIAKRIQKIIDENIEDEGVKIDISGIEISSKVKNGITISGTVNASISASSLAQMIKKELREDLN